jgi:uncharacterized membrane protein YkoI
VKLKPKILISTLVVSGLLGTSACSMTNNKPNTLQTNETSQLIDEPKVVEIASDAVKGGIVINSLVNENGGANKYSVHILKGDKKYEVDVDSSGKVLKINESTQSYEESKLQKVSPKISLEDAEKIALGKVSGTLIEWNLDNFNNRLVYNIEISGAYHQKSNVIVDAMNGKVLKVVETKSRKG